MLGMDGAPPIEKFNLLMLFEYLYDKLSTQIHSAVAMVINAAAGTYPKTGATATFGTILGVPFTVPAGTAMPNPVGATAGANQYVIVAYWASYVNGVLTYTYTYGTPGATLAGATFPQAPAAKGYALLGYLVIQAAAGGYVGGTTALDTGVTSTTYLFVDGAVDPTATYTF
jgi:hypothetical protein